MSGLVLQVMPYGRSLKVSHRQYPQVELAEERENLVMELCQLDRAAAVW